MLWLCLRFWEARLSTQIPRGSTGILAGALSPGFLLAATILGESPQRPASLKTLLSAWNPPNGGQKRSLVFFRERWHTACL